MQNRSVVVTGAFGNLGAVVARSFHASGAKVALIAPLVVYLASDAAADVTGQIFSVRANEIFTFSQPRPVRSVHVADRWTPESIAAVAIPVLRSSFSALDRTQDVFSWDPI
jgi:NAD(P)-dependent dehydrogenase (short-subunit alcohol dehydrogenase family)